MSGRMVTDDDVAKMMEEIQKEAHEEMDEWDRQRRKLIQAVYLNSQMTPQERLDKIFKIDEAYKKERAEIEQEEQFKQQMKQLPPVQASSTRPMMLGIKTQASGDGEEFRM
mmetsp:Transcript_15991/g.39173  ORF Transcript_15991/g.39173 Transcript_15991/m.39173 type:complete len:111 (+) Transcript_15991:291-623(+)